MYDSACRWIIFKNATIIWSYVRRTLMDYANKVWGTAQSYFLIGTVKQS